jgi:Dna[CI] antecedent, DciA
VARPSSSTTLARVFATDPQMAQWQRRIAHGEAILHVVRRVLPRALGAELAVDAGESGELRLVAASGAMAAVLRQRVADLKPALAREGWEFTDIKVVVQPRAAPAVLKKQHTIQWDANATPALRQLRDTLPEGPLKAAVGRLLRQH